MDKETANRIRLGIFVSIGLLLFLTSIFFLGSRKNLFEETFRVSTVFSNVSGLRPGSGIWLAGVNVGTVKQVVIIGDSAVWVDMELEERIREHVVRDATTSISADGLIGNRIVVINPGSAMASSVTTGDTLRSKNMLDTEALMKTGEKTLNNLLAITSDLSKLTGEISRGEGTLGQALADSTLYPSLAAEMRTTLANLRQTSQRTNSLTHDLAEITTQLQSGEGVVGTLLNDTSFADVWETSMSNVKSGTAQLLEITEGLGKLTSDLEKKEGAVGLMVSDTAFSNDIRETMQNLNKASGELDVTLKAAQSNFLLRGYFRKKEKQAKKAAKKE